MFWTPYLLQHFYSMLLPQSAAGESNKYPLTKTSRSRDQLRIAAFTSAKKLITFMETNTQPVPLNKTILWSDGMRAQFRSRFVFILLSNFI